MESQEDLAVMSPPPAAPLRHGQDFRSGDEQHWTIEVIVGAGDPVFTGQLAREAMDAGADRVALRLDRAVHDLAGPETLEERDSTGASGMMACRAADFAELLRTIAPHRLMLLADRAAAPVAACVVAAARSLGQDWRGFGISNDPLGEALASSAAGPDPWALRACRDLALWLAEEAPLATRQTLGAGAEQSAAEAAPEVAAILAHAARYRQLGFGETLRARMACGHRVLNEAAKIRAARQAHAQKFGVSLEIEAVSRIESLGAPQADVNLVRISLQAMAAALGGARTICLVPCEMERTWVRLAVRAQQVLTAETGVTRVADPAAGAGVFERKTAAIAAEALEIAARDFPAVWEAARSRAAATHQPVVGVTRFVTAGAPLRAKPRSLSAWLDALARDGARRDQRSLDESLLRLRDAARGTGNLMPHLIDAAERHATLGEMFICLRDCRS